MDESVHQDEAPVPHCERLARAKALALAAGDRDAVVIGSDTIVVIDGDILGKPRSVEEAQQMLARLSGRTHTVFTAVAAAYAGQLVSGVESVSVTFRLLTSTQIAAYVATGEPMDKAGAYGIQGYGATIVEHIEGDYFAVMGLSLVTVVRLAEQMGVSYHFGPLAYA